MLMINIFYKYNAPIGAKNLKLILMGDFEYFPPLEKLIVNSPFGKVNYKFPPLEKSIINSPL